MKSNMTKWLKTAAISASIVSIVSSCNKDLPDAVPIVTTPPSGETILETIRANGNLYSYLDSAIARASLFNNPAGKLDAVLSNKNAVFTLFAPDNNAFQQSFQFLGLPTGVSTLKGFSPGRLDTLIRYHLVSGNKFTSASIPTTFPNNLYLQSMFLLKGASATSPPTYSMPVFPGKQGATTFANNIPIIQPEHLDAANGVIHRTALLLLPPTQVLWQRIAADPDLTYLKAAVEKADEGDSTKPLQSALLNPAANLTVLAPVNLAFQQLLTGQITLALIPIITQQLIAGGAPPDVAAAQAPALAQAQATAWASTPDVFKNPALAGVLTPTTVKGILVYHLLASQSNNTFQGIRVFSNNIPSSDINSFTLLNSAIAAHPGVTLKATYGFSGVIAITAKGLGNATASNVQINPTPAPGGTSDQHYVNGTLHKIDQVLLPQ